MNDCLIASVAQRLQVPLYTHNLKDMHVLLSTSLVVKPY
jgi:predicted nucleic acid-binding protein